MPTYHYRCSACGHSFDQFQKFSEDALTVCPECGGSIRRVPQPVGIVFKGSGWYITDSRKSNGATGSSSSKSPASSESKEGAKSDTATSSTKTEPPKTPVSSGADNS